VLVPFRFAVVRILLILVVAVVHALLLLLLLGRLPGGRPSGGTTTPTLLATSLLIVLTLLRVARPLIAERDLLHHVPHLLVVVLGAVGSTSVSGLGARRVGPDHAG
jgi:hypothetical protein